MGDLTGTLWRRTAPFSEVDGSSFVPFFFAGSADVFWVDLNGAVLGVFPFFF